MISNIFLKEIFWISKKRQDVQSNTYPYIYNSEYEKYQQEQHTKSNESLGLFIILKIYFLVFNVSIYTLFVCVGGVGTHPTGLCCSGITLGKAQGTK